MSNRGVLVADTTDTEVGNNRPRDGRGERGVTTVTAPIVPAAGQTASPGLMFVMRHLTQGANRRIRVTARDLAEVTLLQSLEGLLICPVHDNFTHRVGYAEPGLLQLDCDIFGYRDEGYVPLLTYIGDHPYEATSRLLYNWNNGSGGCHRLGRIFLLTQWEMDEQPAPKVPEWGRSRVPARIHRDTGFLRDTVSTIEASWAQFHGGFPFHEVAECFLRQDGHSFVLATQLYNAMHEFYFGHRQNAWKRLGRMIPKDDNTEVDMVSQLADLDTSLGRYINRVDRGETGVEREIRTQRM